MSDPASDLTRQHWPHFAALLDDLAAVTATTHQARRDSGQASPTLSQRDIDAIHEGLLRKKRQSGDLKLS